MSSIDYMNTGLLAKEHLKQLSRLFGLGNFKIKVMDVYDIDESVNLDELCEICYPSRLDSIFLRDLQVISRMDIDSKRILYCVHCLGISLWKLKVENIFGDPYRMYKKAIQNYGLTNKQFIVFEN